MFRVTGQLALTGNQVTTGAIGTPQNFPTGGHTIVVEFFGAVSNTPWQSTGSSGGGGALGPAPVPEIALIIPTYLSDGSVSSTHQYTFIPQQGANFVTGGGDAGISSRSTDYVVSQPLTLYLNRAGIPNGSTVTWVQPASASVTTTTPGTQGSCTFELSGYYQ